MKLQVIWNTFNRALFRFLFLFKRYDAQKRAFFLMTNCVTGYGLEFSEQYLYEIEGLSEAKSIGIFYEIFTLYPQILFSFKDPNT